MATTITPTWQDVNRINYFTPRFAGLQIGVGYAPKIIGAAASGQASAGPLNIAGTCGFAGATNINNCPSADYAWQDAFDVGANYLNKFGDFTVALYGAFAYASFVPGYRRWPARPTWRPVPTSPTGSSGCSVLSSASPASPSAAPSAGTTTASGANYFTGVDNDTRFYTAGIMYETGPWQMSFMWAGFYNSNGNGSSNTATIATGTNASDEHHLRRRAGRQQHLLQRQSGDLAVLR